MKGLASPGVAGAWEGERVRLRAIEPADVDLLVDAEGDTDSSRSGWRVFPPRSSWSMTEWVEAASRADTDGDEFRLAVCSLDSGELVGTLSTHHCSPHAGTCSYAVSIFGWQQRRGFGRDAVVVVLRYLFGERRYQKCTVGVYDFNVASIAFHHALGFVTEGRVRRAHFVAGRHRDEVVLGLTAEEYAARWPYEDLDGPGGEAVR